jgi:UDP-N-acetylglucosamine 4,6-dehydratase/5-epimerase
LVVFAFNHGNPGDIFVQKAPSCTLEILAEALRKLFNAPNPIKIIGTRHGEKLYETLLTREELSVAEDLGDYYRVPADNRDLNYASYFSEGRSEVALKEDYNSHNTERLGVEGMCDLLLKLECVQQGLRGEKVEV